MKKNTGLIAAAFTLLLVFAGIADAGYSRIVSLAPAITSSLYDLECQDAVVGVTLYCKAPGKEIIGTLIEPNVEKIVSLRPDLVIAAAEWSNAQAIDKMKALGMNVAVFKKPDNFDEICGNFTGLADIVGKRPMGDKIVSRVKEEAGRVRLRAKGLPLKKVFWQMDTSVIVTMNNQVFASEFIEFSGGLNIFSDLKTTYAQVSCEEVIKRNPDIIILAAMASSAGAQAAYWKRFKDISAVKRNAIFVIDPYKVSQPTPLKFLEGLKETAKLIHPEIFG